MSKRPRGVSAVAVFALCGLACSSEPASAPSPVSASGSAGNSGMTAAATSGAPAATADRASTAGSLAPPAADGGGPARPSGSAGAMALPPSSAAGGSSGVAGAAGAAAGAIAMPPSGGAGAGANHDDCASGALADPRDAQLTGQPDQWKSSSGAIDLVLPKAVLAWMGERVWEESHDAWHNVRRCRMGAFPGGLGGANSICSKTELIAEHQECADAEDGYQFLVMHRHMMQTLRQAFPKHTELFAGFPKFPFEAKDVPVEWQSRWGSGWAPRILETANVLEAIENNLSQFPTEGDLGRYMQCGGMANGASSIHGALHFKWVVNDSPHSLGKQTVNIDNYMFWKLHGWIDQIWERYRVAKGLAPNEPKLVAALAEQCREMHTLGHAVGGADRPVMPTDPLPAERGVFHENVRPILEKTCSGCHSESSPEAGLSLGGRITSAKIVQGLVNVPSMRGGQFKRVVPGNPSESWLFLKTSGMAATAGCTGAACNTQVMPPAGQVTLTSTELNTIRQWIIDGAIAPSS